MLLISAQDFQKGLSVDIKPYIKSKPGKGSKPYLPWVIALRLLREHFPTLYPTLVQAADGGILWGAEADRPYLLVVLTDGADTTPGIVFPVRDEMGDTGFNVLLERAQMRAWVKAIAVYTGIGLSLWDKDAPGSSAGSATGSSGKSSSGSGSPAPVARPTNKATPPADRPQNSPLGIPLDVAQALERLNLDGSEPDEATRGLLRAQVYEALGTLGYTEEQIKALAKALDARPSVLTTQKATEVIGTGLFMLLRRLQPEASAEVVLNIVRAAVLSPDPGALKEFLTQAQDLMPQASDPLPQAS